MFSYLSRSLNPWVLHGDGVLAFTKTVTQQDNLLAPPCLVRHLSVADDCQLLTVKGGKKDQLGASNKATLLDSTLGGNI